MSLFTTDFGDQRIDRREVHGGQGGWFVVESSDSMFGRMDRSAASDGVSDIAGQGTLSAAASISPDVRHKPAADQGGDPGDSLAATTSQRTRRLLVRPPSAKPLPAAGS